MRDLIEAVDMGKCEVVYPPNDSDTDKTTVFLAGTIDMGKSHDWQSEMVARFHDTEVCFLNPRRKEWDSSWKQDISEPKFNEQVTWELDYQESANYIIMYFAPTSQSPITLLELGLAAGSYPEKVLVACPEGYWRRGNVQIVCSYYGIRLYETLEELTAALEEELKK